MEILPNVVIEVGKLVCQCIYPKMENIVCFSSKIENLSEEMEKLKKLREDIKGKVEIAEGEGYKPKPDVVKWIEDVEKVENDWGTMKESIEAAKMLTYKCCPNCSLRLEVGTQVQKIRDKVCRLTKAEESFGSNLMVENYRMEKVEYLEVPPIKDQPTARKNIDRILKHLENDKVCIIGVWGAGGIGKTTLMKNLNNELRQIDVSRPKLCFGVVVWITMPKPAEISKVQALIAKRLCLEVDNGGSKESSANKIYQRFKKEKRFLLILDDVWEAINLDHVGVPHSKNHAGSNVIIVSRFRGVCKKMKTHTEINISILDENESWHLFIKNAGDVANRVDIQPSAMDIARECGGLPLAITVIGTSMRGKSRVELWEDALESLRMCEPCDEDVIHEVYKVIKLSFDYLESRDTELSLEERSNMNKRRGDIKSCFLYCSLYPVDIQTDDLINCWWAEGFLGEHDTYENAYNRGTTMIDRLKDVCLLEEAHWTDCVKMHDLVRDVAKWIANSSNDEHNSVIEAGIGLTEISHTKLSASVKRISFISNKIEHLPDCVMVCPRTTSLLLQDNEPLEKIPDDFFSSFPALRVVNLSETGIRALPSSINSLSQLRALILRDCYELKELPDIGNLCNLQLLDCENTGLRCLPIGMHKLTNLRLLNMPTSDLESSIGQGFFQKLSSLEIINMMGGCLGSTCFDEISFLHNLTSLFIRLDSSSILKREHNWMKRLKSFHIEIGETSAEVPFNKSTKRISVSHCETFSNGELSGMLQFASYLYLEKCGDLRKLIENNSFDGLKSLHIESCSCDFTAAAEEEGSEQFDDPLPNLKHISLSSVHNLKCVSDFGHFLGSRFSGLRQLDISNCGNLTCLFNVGGAFSVPNHLEEINIFNCSELVELLVQCGSSQRTLVNSEILRVRKLSLKQLPTLRTFGESESMWVHLEELEVISCNEIRKLPLSIQNSNNIKQIKGESEWWSQLEWDDHNYKSNLKHCFTAFDQEYWNEYPYTQVFADTNPSACRIS
ncbi:disease resistance protein At4g27190-like [Solanum stenotomum]|uniref:disease resistance protein At4g27190-like n=1 Tax=Solanum stenotomum TaxID=172797 RepID=UPI0020D1AD7A|nr:disease resistance protein At4g27190-like [Solanum stenotomum]